MNRVKSAKPRASSSSRVYANQQTHIKNPLFRGLQNGNESGHHLRGR